MVGILLMGILVVSGIFQYKMSLHVLFMGDRIINNSEYFPFLSFVPTLETSLCIKGNATQTMIIPT